MAAPTHKEIELLRTFRETLRTESVLGPEDPRFESDYFLLRWLRARNHDLGKAKVMLQTSLAWRAENGVAALPDTPRDTKFDKVMPYKLAGHDKEGRPRLLLDGGNWNIRELAIVSTPEEAVLDFARTLECIARAIAASGNLRGLTDLNGSPIPVTQFTAICEMNGFGFGSIGSWGGVSSILKMALTMEAHYPEISYAMYFINSSRAVVWIMNIIKKCLARATSQKMHAFGYDSSEWWPKLIEAIYEEHLRGLSLHGAPPPDSTD